MSRKEAVILVEGETERSILKTLVNRLEVEVDTEKINPFPYKGTGCDAVKANLANLVAIKLYQEPLRCMALLDVDCIKEPCSKCDQPCGKSEGNLVRAITDDVKKKLTHKDDVTAGKKEFSLKPLTEDGYTYSNIHIFEQDIPETRIVVYLANERLHNYEYFYNKTSDDYILSLMEISDNRPGFFRELVERGIKRGEKGNPKIIWPPLSEAAFYEVVNQLVAVLRNENLPDHIEAKMYLKAYALVARENRDYWQVNDMILKGATTKSLTETFRSLIAAVRFLNK
jgi:hypothetical protein